MGERVVITGEAGECDARQATEDARVSAGFLACHLPEGHGGDHWDLFDRLWWHVTTLEAWA